MWSNYNVFPGAICCCLQRNKYDQSLWVTDIYNLITVCCFVFELWVLNLKKKNMNKTPYHSPHTSMMLGTMPIPIILPYLVMMLGTMHIPMYRLDAEPRELRDLVSRGPWAVGVPSADQGHEAH